MQIIKTKIRYTGNDQNITIPIGGNIDQLGIQQEIDNYVLEKTTGSINGVTDVEIKRFKFRNFSPKKTLDFGFHYYSGGDYWSSYFSIAGFTTDDIDDGVPSYLNSFFILDLFDTYEGSEQTKILSTYLTNLTSTNTSDYYSIYSLTNENQFYDLNVPMNIFNDSNDPVTAYARFSFYNAKTGEISVFYNLAKDGTAEKMYFEIELDPQTKIWEFAAYPMRARELPYDSNQAYLDRYNETFGDFINQQQNYPTGNVFIDNGTYETT